MTFCFSMVLILAVAAVGFLTMCVARQAAGPGLPRVRGRGMLTNLRASVACLALLAVSVVFAAGCTDQQKQTTVQIMTQVNAYAPSVVAAADTVAALFATNPEIALIAAPVDMAFDALAKTVQALAASYIANPNASVLQQLQAAVNTLEASINTSTLAAVKITDPISQQLALAALKGLLTVVTLVFGLISQTETKAQLVQFRQTETVRLASVRPYMDQRVLADAAKRAGLDINVLFAQADAFGL